MVEELHIGQPYPTVSDGDRFVDHGLRIYDLGEEFLVECPNCSMRGKVIPSGELPQKVSDQLFAARKYVCLNCLHRKEWSGKQIAVGGAADWYFGLPLWLRISCCGETLWAYNVRHLDILEGYVSAKLRERTNKGRNSFLSKLPKWTKSAKNRDEILRAIEKLRIMADARSK